MISPFVINDLPNGTCSVTWPGHEYNVVNNPDQALTLLEILFEVVGVEEAMIGVQEPGRDNDWRTWHISSLLWLDDREQRLMASRLANYVVPLANYVVPGVRFTDIYQAEKFKDHMEQRLAWKRLSNGQEWS